MSIVPNQRHDISRQPDSVTTEQFSRPPDSYFQIFDTYMMTRQEGGLIIIDQHTAHERILFEKNLDNFERQGSLSQQLLFEERVKLTPEESHLCVEIGDLLAKAGFEIRPFAADEFIISGLPQEMADASAYNAIKGSFRRLCLEPQRRSGSKKRALAAALACKAAAKAGTPSLGILRCEDFTRIF